MPDAQAEVRPWSQLQSALRQAGQRRLVLLEGDRARALAWLRRHLSALGPATGGAGSGLWSGPPDDCPHSGLTCIRPEAGRQWLGREVALLVWDGWQGNPPDSLAALAGTITAGGLWFWLMPPLAEWEDFPDPDYSRTGLADAGAHPFAGRMARVLASDPAVIRVRVDSEDEPVLPEAPAPEVAFETGTTNDQLRAIREIVRTGRGRRRRPLVVTADRGRGKSAALGLAAMSLLRTSARSRILVTAPAPEAVRTLFHHARAEAGPEAIATGDDFRITLVSGAELVFMPVDELLGQRPEAGLVLVDEAAAIPAPLLRSILSGWPRVVYASTIHGYEGAGRGFTLRFRQVLDAQTPQWRSIRLDQPVRWHHADPLEPLVNRLFLLDATASEAAPEAALTIDRWQPAESSEQVLGQAFGLLVEAHYRTTPGDLRQLLDDPASVCWLARCGGVVVGVLWLTVEGGLSPELAHSVMQGRRRLRGHLLPQSLACHSGFGEAAVLRMARVVRVAVSDSCRRQGLGQRLLTAARDYSLARGLAGLGASFGASPELLAFWQRCQLPLVRLGLHREASSGEYAVQVVAGLTEPGRDLVGRIRKRLASHWQTLLSESWPDLAPELVFALTDQLPPARALEEDDVRELAAFCQGWRGFELSLLPLRRLSRGPGAAGWLGRQPHASLWCRAVLQGWSWPALQAAGECAGRKEGEQRLRALAADLLVQAGVDVTTYR